MKRFPISIAALALLATGLASCSVSQDSIGRPNQPTVVGKVTSEADNWQTCIKNQCSTRTSAVIYAGEGLKSYDGSMTLEVYGANKSKSPHKLLGRLDAISVSEKPSLVSFTLADGTLSGEVDNQPTKVVFTPGPNSNKKAAYCEFSTGKYEAINYLLNVFEISGGEALCFDKEGVEHKITDEKFSI